MAIVSLVGNLTESLGPQISGLFMIVFVPYSLWMWLTTKDQREMIFGYLLLFSVIAYIARFFLGEGSSIDF